MPWIAQIVNCVSIICESSCRKVRDEDVIKALQRSHGKHEEEFNNRPLIGVLSQVKMSKVPGHYVTLSVCSLASDSTFVMQPGEPAPEGMSYIAASYVKFIEVSRLILTGKTQV